VSRYMTAEQVSAEFQIPLKTLYRWRATTPAKGPRAIRVGRWLRYSRAEVERWLAERAEAERSRYSRAQ
jgi:predicted DNA-binding transcriptional regulator AlpA